MRIGLGRASVASFVVMAALAAAQLGASCVDGVTPDCSDPAVCAPSEGDAAFDARPAQEASVIPAPPDAAAVDAGRDAEAGDAAEGG